MVRLYAPVFISGKDDLLFSRMELAGGTAIVGQIAFVLDREDTDLVLSFKEITGFQARRYFALP